MKEQDLIDLGFEINHDEENGKPYYYYTYDIGKYDCLISNTNDEGDVWYIELFESDEIRFTNKEELKLFIDLINRNKK
jgi:hypothetical protein